MNANEKTRLFLCFAVAVLLVLAGRALSQTAARVAQIPGIKARPCNPGPEEKPWLNKAQTPECRALEAIAQMTPEEKQRELGGITGLSANQRMGLASGGGSDGPNGISTMRGNPQPRGRDVTAFANAVTLAATWNRDLAAQYGKALGEEFAGKGFELRPGADYQYHADLALGPKRRNLQRRSVPHS